MMRGNNFRDDLLAKFSPHLQTVSPSGTFAHLQANEQEEFHILEMEVGKHHISESSLGLIRRKIL